MNNLILFGFKNSGKSTLGKKIAKLLKCPFFDTDKILEMRQGASCRELHLKWGELEFRRMEHEVVESLKGVSGSVIALGGGTVLDEKTRQLVELMGTLLYLDVEKHILKKRLLSAPERPSFVDEDSFDAVYSERKLIYERIAYGK